MQLVNYVAITISDTMFISTTETVQLFFVTATAEAALFDDVMSYDNVGPESKLHLQRRYLL